jgi:hypothetical protein
MLSTFALQGAIMGGADDLEENDALAQMLHDEEKYYDNKNVIKTKAYLRGPQYIVVPRL